MTEFYHKADLATLREILNLTNELCDSVDALSEDVGGHRKPDAILAEIGPRIIKALAILDRLQAQESREDEAVAQHQMRARFTTALEWQNVSKGYYEEFNFHPSSSWEGRKLYTHPAPKPSAPAIQTVSGVTCVKCGAAMRYNVPRLGPDGGYVHAASGSLDCHATAVSNNYVVTSTHPTEPTK